MKAFILIGLIALVFSQRSFLRDLQQSGPISSGPTSSSLSDFIIQGVWKEQDTDCPSDCHAEMTCDTNEDGSEMYLSLKYEDDSSCGDKAGKTYEATETCYNGMWADQNPDSPFYKWAGIYRLNNKTEMITYPNPNADDGSYCYMEWAGSYSTQSSYEKPTEKYWEGYYVPDYYYASRPGEEEKRCCVPEKMYVYEDLDTQTVECNYYTPYCDGCGDKKNKMYKLSMSVYGGGGYDATHPEVSSFMYKVGDKIAYNSPACCIYYKKQEPTCPTYTNTPPKKEVPTYNNDTEYEDAENYPKYPPDQENYPPNEDEYVNGTGEP